MPHLFGVGIHEVSTSRTGEMAMIVVITKDGNNNKLHSRTRHVKRLGHGKYATLDGLLIEQR